ncbi:hypothetical protein EDD27_6442 [Nonomuraea polychroma]|uniref:Uncharacterized protein n=1 Tax=Nonomuraea polychroma TaxID=46176 RepID=A0A438MDQ0_9ACTN|nr:hypothetical protein [Nonomuraea polychroma]RVX43748.1 hypothetical protein EDD27_6442 [Nonomuraea polychroma]
MAELLVEIHVPLREDPRVSETDYPFPWIDAIEEFLVEMEEQKAVGFFDDGEEFGDVYVFFTGGAEEDVLLRAASRVAALDGVPGGVFAMVTDDEAGEFGLGRRVDLPLA